MDNRDLSVSTAIMTVVALIALAVGSGVGESVQSRKTVEDAYLGLSSGPLAAATIADLPEGIVLQSGNLQITRDELREHIEEGAATPAERVGLQAEAFYVLEQLAVPRLLARQARDWAASGDEGSNEEVIDSYLQHVAEQVTVTDEEVRRFYQANRSMLGGVSFDDAKEYMRSVVLRQRQEEAVRDEIASLSRRYRVRVDAGFVADVAPKAFNNPVDEARRGAKPAVVDFGSSGCHACDNMAPILEELRLELGDRVNVVVVQVRQHPYLSARYGVRSIPAQLIFDAEGREVFHHVGYLSRRAIVEELRRLGVE